MKKAIKLVSTLLVIVMLLGIVPMSASAKPILPSIHLDFHFIAGGYDQFSVPAGSHLETGLVYYECSDGSSTYDIHARSGYQYTMFAKVYVIDGYTVSESTAFSLNGVSIPGYTSGNNVPAGYFMLDEENNAIVFRVRFNELKVVDEKGKDVPSGNMNRFYIKGEKIPFTGFEACNDSRHLSSLSISGTGASLKYTGTVVGNEVTMGEGAATLRANFVYNHDIYKKVLKKSKVMQEGEFVYACHNCSFKDPESSRALPYVDYEYEGFNDGISEGKTLYYNGENQYLGISLWYDGFPLKQSEYQIDYPAESRKVGRYVAHVTLSGEYFEDAFDYEYYIYLGKPQVKAKVGVNTITLSWKKVLGAKAYRVYEYNFKTGKYKAGVNTKKLSYTFKNKAAGTKYAYIVRAYYVNSAGKEVLSPYSKADSLILVTLCAAPKPTASVYGKTVTLKWAKCAGAKYYRVYQYNTKTKKYSILVKSTTKLNVKLTKQSKGTHYYLVRAFNAANVGSNYSTKNLKKVVVR